MKRFIFINKHLEFNKILKKYHLYSEGDSLYINGITHQKWLEVFQDYNGDDRILIQLPYQSFCDIITLLNSSISPEDVWGYSLMISRDYGQEFLAFLEKGEWKKPFTKNIRIFSKAVLPTGYFIWPSNTCLDEHSKKELVDTWDSIYGIIQDIL